MTKTQYGVKATIWTVVAAVAVLAIVLVGLPTYNVYSKQMQGRAAYEEAVQNRRIRVLEDAQEAHAATDALMRRYAPASTEACRTAEITREMPALSVWEMTIDHMTGKEAIELLRARG